MYLAYILIYLLNGWLKRQWMPILVFTGVFLLGYGVIWLLIYTFTKAKTNQLNKKLSPGA